MAAVSAAREGGTELQPLPAYRKGTCNMSEAELEETFTRSNQLRIHKPNAALRFEKVSDAVLDFFIDLAKRWDSLSPRQRSKIFADGFGEILDRSLIAIGKSFFGSTPVSLSINKERHTFEVSAQEGDLVIEVQNREVYTSVNELYQTLVRVRRPIILLANQALIFRDIEQNIVDRTGMRKCVIHFKNGPEDAVYIVSEGDVLMSKCDPPFSKFEFCLAHRYPAGATISLISKEEKDKILGTDSDEISSISLVV
jgi:hypothetical protein